MDESKRGSLPSAEEARENLLRFGTADRSVMCWVCGHSCHLHYVTGEEHQGCVADTPPRIGGAAFLFGGEVPRPSVVDADGVCLCPGWERGALPRAMTKHLIGLVSGWDDEDIPCAACVHFLSVHSDPEGCWMCPCDVSEHERQTS